MNSGILFLYSYRNLWRNSRRTWLMLVSLGLGVGFIQVNMNFSRSGVTETKKEFLRHFVGEYTITNPAYFKSADKKKFDKYKTIRDSDFKSDILHKTTPRITAQVYLAGNKKTLGALMVGIDPVQEKKFSTIHHSLMSGKYLDESSENELVLGAKLARQIGAKVGDEVSLIGQANDGSSANENLRLVGILDLGGGDLEGLLALVPLKKTQEILVMGESYHERIQFDEKKPNVQGLLVTPWEDLLPEVASSMRFSVGFLYLVSLVVSVLISVGLANGFLITFFHREKEFQTLQVLGTSSRWVLKSLLVEGACLVGLGLIIGLSLGSLVSYYFQIHPLDMQFLNGGKPLLLGGMKIRPLVRITPYGDPFWQIPLLVIFFFGVSMLRPLTRVIGLHRTRFSKA